MKSKLLISAALVALVAAGCNKQADNNSGDTQQSETQQGIAVGEPNPSAPTGQTPTTQKPTETKNDMEAHFSDGNDAEVAPTPEVIGVDITSTGFSPASVTIQKGDYIQFTNKDSATHWPASDPHPSHSGYPGFDADKALKTGETYRFQFDKVGTWGFHDHFHPAFHGTIIVK